MSLTVRKLCLLSAATTVAALGCDLPEPRVVDDTAPVPAVAECPPASPGTPVTFRIY